MAIAVQENTDLALYHLARVPEKTMDKHPLLVLMHGHGSNEMDLMGMAPNLDDRFIIASLRGPKSYSPGSHRWYRVNFMPSGFEIDLEEGAESAQIVEGIVPDLVELYDADPQNVYLMGFSQGAIMSVTTLLNKPELVNGIVAMSGRLVEPLVENAAPTSQLDGKWALVQHGTQDTVIGLDHGRAIRDRFEGTPVNLTYSEYPMPHTISQQSFEEATAWLTARLDS